MELFWERLLHSEKYVYVLSEPKKNLRRHIRVRLKAVGKLGHWLDTCQEARYLLSDRTKISTLLNKFTATACLFFARQSFRFSDSLSFRLSLLLSLVKSCPERLWWDVPLSISTFSFSEMKRLAIFPFNFSDRFTRLRDPAGAAGRGARVTTQPCKTISEDSEHKKPGGKRIS